MTKIKKELITKAKVKKQYAKIKAEHKKQAEAEPTIAEAAQIHPERQAMLDSSARPHRRRPQATDDAAPTPASETETNPAVPEQEQEQDQDQQHQHQYQQEPERQKKRRNEPRERRPRQQRPDYFRKELAAAELARQQAEARAAETARREEERRRRVDERERYRKAMAKAKAPGRDGKRKIGRESTVLLDRVRKLMGGQ